MTKDLKPLFLWAKEIEDIRIYDRILIKIIPALVKVNIQITKQLIELSETVMVPTDIFELAVIETEKLLDMKYEGVR